MSSSDEELDRLRIPLEDILIATNDFSEENVLKRSETSDVYKGVLPLVKIRDVNVAIRRYTNTTLAFDFYQEVKMLSHFSHRNIVSLIGFCDDKDERMIVMEHVVNGSFDKYLSDATTLSWAQKLQICVTAASALEYMDRVHMMKGRGFKILLHKYWEAKVLIICTENSECDVVYSMGMILVGVLCGRKATAQDVNRYRAVEELAHLDHLVDPNLRKQMIRGSLDIVTVTAYDCLKKQSNRRHDMYHIVRKLNDAFDIQWKHGNDIPFEEIMSATNNFHRTYLLKANKYNQVYKAELNHFDRKSALTEERKNKGNQLKKTVILVRIDVYDSKKRDIVIAQIKMLTSCKHPNLLPFLGFCEQGFEMFLVFEYASKETLVDYLECPGNNSWEQRIRISLDIAHGLKYLLDMECKPSMIHQVMQSACIFLDENWTAKMANFNLLINNPKNFLLWQQHERMEVVGDHIYFLGVVLFEILTGGLVDDPLSVTERVNGLATLKNMVDRTIMGKAQESLDAFTVITYQCLALETPNERPTLEVAIKSLEKALDFQLRLKDSFAYLKIPLSDIKLATYDFADAYCIKSQGDNMVYRGELDHFYTECVSTIEGENNSELPKKTVIIKRLIDIQKYEKRRNEFIAEIEMLNKCKHPNLLSLLGFCDEDSEMILVFECAFKQTLVDYLKSMSTTYHTWEQRIRISLDIAHGLKYLHDMEGESSIIYQGMLSAYVVMDQKGTAKIANFRSWLWGPIDVPRIPSNQRLVEVDIYSLGIFLFEILSGRLAYDPFYKAETVDEFASMARRHFNEGKLENIADPRIMEETQKCSYTVKIGPNQDSFHTFSKIAYQCLIETPSERPTLEVVIKSLEKALDFQLHNLEHLKIPLEDIQLATENFHPKYLLGYGGYGEVYKAELNHLDTKSFLASKMHNEVELPKVRNTVAIKRIFNKKDGEAGFLAELDTLSTCEHPHIVSLLGFCVEGNEMLLVYEHVFHGSLDNFLEKNMINLTWMQRLKMSIDIAQGLKHLHTDTDDKRRIIHRDIKSANILLGRNWEAKIADFGLSRFHPMNQHDSTINTMHIAGTNVYLDPEYARTGKLKKASDIYSFGVVLFEIFSGTLAYDARYTHENEKGLAPIAQRHFENGTLKELLDPKITNEAHELSSSLKVGPCEDSLNAFSKIAYRCLAKTQAKRPTIEDVIKELQKAVKFQENRKDTFKMSLEDISLGVRNFNDENCIIRGGYRKLYRGEVQYNNENVKVVVKRFNRSVEEHGYLTEFEFLFTHKQENIIGLKGYCKEMDEEIIVYENASNGCLCSYLNDTNFSWSTRLKICIDIAKGLNFIHGGEGGQEVVIHRDLKSNNILLTEDWKAKICGFELSLTYPINQELEYDDKRDVVGSPGYCDPLYWETHILTKESDIYALGVILFEILCGRLACPEDFVDSSQFLDVMVKRHFQVARVDEIVFEGIKEHIVLESLATFRRIAFQCLHEERKERPTAGEVLVQLHKALEFQEAYEIWEARLPTNYKEILQFSECPDIYSTMAKKDLHNILFKGILLKDDNLWFSIGDNGERNEMISARLFSFKNRWSHRWRSIQESRFRKVAEMLDISNLNIQIKIRPQFLPSDVNYSVHLVFKFCGPSKSHAKRMYVNLKYKMGKENSHTYFATRRDDDWMIIELCRFLNHKKDTNFEVLLEGFSRCYCDSRAIYIEGIEFRAVDNVTQEKMEKLEVQQVLKSHNKMKIKKHQMLWYSLSKMKRKVYHMESAKGIVYDPTNLTLLKPKFSAQSRLEWIYKVPRRSVFCIKWYIKKYQIMMSQNTECACYLVFKLSENCDGLYCPVIIRDQFHWKSKEIIYFRSPSSWNLHDTDRVPNKRKDGWLEVIVSKFNSDFVLKNGFLSGKLKLVSYEGTMLGLIIRGLEFRPMEE